MDEDKILDPTILDTINVNSEYIPEEPLRPNFDFSVDDNLFANSNNSTSVGGKEEYELNQIKERAIYLAKKSPLIFGKDPNEHSTFSLGGDFAPHIGEREININDSHIKIGEDYYAKTETYLEGFDNEDYDAHNQSTWSKWGNGLSKFAGKTGVNVVGGTVGIVNGLAKAVSEGSLSAFYSNDFNHYLDDLNKKMDYSLPNYATNEEKSMNFIQQMGTANFWAKDMLDGASFIVGTVASEVLWGLATGGTSLLATMPKYAVRKAAMREAMKLAEVQALKGAAKKTALKGFAREMIKDSGKIVDIYGAAIPASRRVEALTNTRFIFTTSAYEAGMEARHTLDDAITAFDIAYEQNYNREPTKKEREDFLDNAKTSANLVFAANIPLIAAGNLATIGNATVVGRRINSKLKFGENLFGLKITKSIGKDGISFIKPSPSRLNKLTGSALSYLKAPFSEGVIEEGGQSVISTTASNWLASKYNPGAMKENISLIDEISSSFKHTYGTKEGFKEVGIGMLIGFLGHQGSRVSQSGNVGSFFGNDYSQKLNSQNELVDRLNSSSNRLGETLLPGQRFLLRKLGGVNTINTYSKSAINSLEEGDEFVADLSQTVAQFSHHSNLRDAGMEDTFVEQAHFMIDNQSDDIYIEQGVDKENIDKYKAKLKEKISEQYDINKKSFDIAEAFAPHLSDKEIIELQKSGVSVADMKSVLALELAVGANSFKNMKYYADQITELTSLDGAGRYKYIYDNLSKSGKIAVERYNSLKSEKESIENEIKQLEDVVAKYKMSETLVNSDDIKDNSKIKIPKLNDAIQKLHELRSSIVDIENKINSINLRKSNLFTIDKKFLGGITDIFKENDNDLISSDDIADSLSKVKEIDNYIQNLRVEAAEKGVTKGRKLALENQIKEIEYVIDQYNAHTQAFKTLNENFEIRTDVKYAYKSYKGLATPFANVGRKYIKGEDLADDTDSWERLEAYIESDPTLSEYDKFSLRANHRIILNSSKFENSLLIKTSFSNETINAKIWSKFIEDKEVDDEVLKQIALNELNSIPLSSREKTIRDSFSDKIEDIKSELKVDKGDSIEDIIEFNPVNIDYNSIIGKLKDLINKVKQANVHTHNSELMKVDKPTEYDYQKFKVLLNLDSKGKLSNKTKIELKNLRDKINKWGRLAGTIVNNDTSLADLIENLNILENKDNPHQEKEGILTSLLNIDDMISDKDFLTMSSKNSNYRIMQSYDKAMVSKTKLGYRVHNLNINGFLDLVSKSSNVVEVKLNGKVITTNKGYWDIKKYKGSYAITIGNNKIFIEVNDAGNIILKENSKKLINSLTNIRIMPSTNTNIKYQPLLFKIDNKLLPVSHNFTFSRGQIIDNDAIYRLKEGDKVHLEVDFKDDFNNNLIKKYKNIKEKGSDEDIENVRKEIVSTIHIYLKDKDNNLVGVVKSLKGNTLIDKSDKDYLKLLQIRESAASELIDDIELDDNITDLGISLDVAFVYEGHPNIEIDANTLKPIKREFTDSAISKVKDIGYIKNGKILTKNDTELPNKQIFIDVPLNSKKYKDKIVPIVIVEYNGRNIAYPIDLKISPVDKSQIIPEILGMDISSNEKIKLINKVIVDNNLDVNKYGIMFGELTKSNLEKISEELSNSINYADVKKWVSSPDNIEDILKREALINIDLDNKPFHSPKIVTKFDNYGYKYSTKDKVGVVSVSSGVKKAVSKIIKNKC